MLDSLRRRSASPTNLLDIIGEVRTRWRMKLALRGALAVAGIGFGLFLARRLRHGVGTVQRRLDPRRPRRAARRPRRLGVLVPVRPLRRRVTDEQVALYLEEHEPSLQATLLSAVEASRNGHIPESAALVRRVVEQAIEACVAHRRVAPRRAAAAAPLRRGAGGVALVARAGARCLVPRSSATRCRRCCCCPRTSRPRRRIASR